MSSRNARWAVHPLLSAVLLLAAATVAPAAAPQILTATEARDGLVLTAALDARNLVGGALVLETLLVNQSDRPVHLSGEAGEGLLFQITVPDGRVFLDAGALPGVEAVRTLAPGESRRFSIDLAHRDLVAVLGCPWTVVGKARGVFDEAFADVPHMDVHVAQRVGETVIELEGMRVVRNVFLFDRAEAFAALHEEAPPEPAAGVTIWDPVHPIQPAPSHVPGSVLVRFEDALSAKDATERMVEVGYEVDGAVAWDLTRTLNVRVPTGTEQEAAAFLRTVPGVVHASLNHVAWIM